MFLTVLVLLSNSFYQINVFKKFTILKIVWKNAVEKSEQPKRWHKIVYSYVQRHRWQVTLAETGNQRFKLHIFFEYPVRTFSFPFFFYDRIYLNFICFVVFIIFILCNIFSLFRLYEGIFVFINVCLCLYTICDHGKERWKKSIYECEPVSAVHWVQNASFMYETKWRENEWKIV